MSRSDRLYVDLHVIQTLPPNCINRDDTGSPKTATYGGVTRARVSSQAWKRAMRVTFKEMFPAENVGKRTKSAVDLVKEKISELDAHCDAEKMAEMALDSAGIKVKKGKTDALLFISDAQVTALAKLAVDKEEDKKRYKEVLKAGPSIDIALFGRMVASDPSLNFDAAAQVAHSISTHAVYNEYDYFTAVDDLAPEDNAGAGHLGTVEFNSATMYRYATVNVKELAENLGADTAVVVKRFAEAFFLSMPTGRQNTFANRTVPDMIYVTIRTDQPVNLAGAFEEPVVAGNGGYVEPSARRLEEYAQKVYQNFLDAPQAAYVCSLTGIADDSLGKQVKLQEMLVLIEENVRDLMEDTERLG